MASIAAGRASEAGGKWFKGNWAAKAIGRALEAYGKASETAGMT